MVEWAVGSRPEAARSDRAPLVMTLTLALVVGAVFVRFRRGEPAGLLWRPMAPVRELVSGSAVLLLVLASAPGLLILAPVGLALARLQGNRDRLRAETGVRSAP